MYVLVHHKVLDPQKFMSIAESEARKPPLGLRLLATIQSIGGTQVMCLWEGASIEAVKGYLESKIGTVSMNEYLEADATTMFGIAK